MVLIVTGLGKMIPQLLYLVVLFAVLVSKMILQNCGLVVIFASGLGKMILHNLYLIVLIAVDDPPTLRPHPPYSVGLYSHLCKDVGC